MKRYLPLLFLPLLAAVLLGANEPVGSNQLPGDPYSRVGANGPAVATSMGTTPACTTIAPGGSVCAFYSYGSTVQVRSAGACSCFWTARPITAVGAQTGETATQVTTALGSEAGCGTSFAAGDRDDLMPWYSVVSEGCPFSWTGTYCSTAITGFGGGAVYPACVDNTECTALSAGTCTRTSNLGGGLRLECKCDATALVSVGLKR